MYVTAHHGLGNPNRSESVITDISNARLIRAIEHLLAKAGVAGGPQEDGVEHRLGDPAGERVLLAWVIAAEYQQAVKLDLGPVAEHGAGTQPQTWRAALELPDLAPRGLPAVMTQADDDPQARRSELELSRQPGLAGIPLDDRGLVLRWCALDGRQHARADQPLPVPGGNTGGLRGQAAPPQRGEKKVAAAVAGEDPAGPV